MRRHAWRGPIAPLLVLLLSCGAPGPGARPIEAASARTPLPSSAEVSAETPAAAEAVVIVTLDGARWQDVLDPMNMPYLTDIAQTRGAVVGAPGRGEVRATGPNYVSLPGYTEIFTGRTPDGCRDNDCATVAIPTLADEVAARGQGAAVFASWECIERAATSLHGDVLVSAGQTGDLGEPMNPWPGVGAFRPDRFTARAALSYLEHQRPGFLFVGLGEPDELAHRGDRPGYLRSLHAADGVLADLFATLDRMGERGARTAVFVTADHGRAADFRNHGGAYPESARVWLVAAGAGVRARGTIDVVGARRLADVAPTVRVLLGLPRDAAKTAGAPILELVAAPPASALAQGDGIAP